MNQAYDRSMAFLLLVSCIGPSSFSSPQLLKELMYSFHCDGLIEIGREWFRFEIWRKKKKKAHTRPMHLRNALRHPFLTFPSATHWSKNAVIEVDSSLKPEVGKHD